MWKRREGRGKPGLPNADHRFALPAYRTRLPRLVRSAWSGAVAAAASSAAGAPPPSCSAVVTLLLESVHLQLRHDPCHLFHLSNLPIDEQVFRKGRHCSSSRGRVWRSREQLRSRRSS